MKNLVLKTCGSISSGSIIIGKVNLPSGSFNPGWYEGGRYRPPLTKIVDGEVL